MTTSVTVSLDTQANPAVSVSTRQLVIDSIGDQTIQWQPGGSTPFTFSMLEILTTPNPITIDSVANSLITATDDNEAAGTYKYRITVMSNGTPYNTDKRPGPGAGDPGDPEIENKEPD